MSLRTVLDEEGLKFNKFDRTYLLPEPELTNPLIRVEIDTGRTIVAQAENLKEMRDALPTLAEKIADHIIALSEDGTVAFRQICMHMDSEGWGRTHHAYISMLEGMIFENLIDKGHGCKASNLRSIFKTF